jgi:hypothetical protein
VHVQIELYYNPASLAKALHHRYGRFRADTVELCGQPLALGQIRRLLYSPVQIADFLFARPLSNSLSIALGAHIFTTFL